MFKKILSSIGIGSAKIDLVLDQSVVTMGETLNGKLLVTGGTTEQQIGNISVDLRVNSRYESNDQTRSYDKSVSSVKISDAFTIQPGETRELPFTCRVPEYIPMSSVTTRYYFLTNLDIQAGLDSTDRDYIQVLPNGLMKNFIDGFKALGCVPKLEGFNGSYQIIDFRTTTWLAGKLDELVFSFQPAQSNREIAGYFEIDKKTSGIGGWLADEMDLDEKKGAFRFTSDQLQTVEQAQTTIRVFVEKYYSGLMG